MEPVKRKAGRPRVEKAAPQMPGPSIKITAPADHALARQAAKLKMNKCDYASAAIMYFTENGLDPTANVSEGLAGLSAAMLKETMQGRA